MNSNKLIGYILLLYIVFLFAKNNHKETKNNIIQNIQEVNKWYDITLKHDNIKDNEYILQNDEIKVTFSSIGGSIKSVELKNFKRYDGNNVILLNHDSNITNFKICDVEKCVDIYDKVFDVINIEKNRIILEYKIDELNKIVQVYSLDTINKFAIHYELIISDKNKTVNMFIDNSLLQQECTFNDCRYNSNVVYCNYNNKTYTLSQDMEKNIEKNDLNVKWIAFKQKFFTTGISIDNENNTNVCLYPHTEKNIQHTKTQIDFKINDNVKLKYYFGPNKFKEMMSFTDKFSNIVYYGIPGVRTINKYLILPMIDFFDANGVSAILIILLLVLILKLLLLPFAIRMQKMTDKLKIISPILQKLSEKYKDDQQQYVFEQLKLYKEYNINPFTPILDGLVQIPFIIAMFNSIPKSMVFRNKNFLWCSDLSSYDSILNFSFNIPFYGDHVSLLAFMMMIITSFCLIFKNSFGNMGYNMKMFMIVSSIMMLCLSNNFCAALNVYYMVFSLFTLFWDYCIKAFVHGKYKCII